MVGLNPREGVRKVARELRRPDWYERVFARARVIGVRTQVATPTRRSVT
jgi:hypothetical protein